MSKYVSLDSELKDDGMAPRIEFPPTSTYVSSLSEPNEEDKVPVSSLPWSLRDCKSESENIDEGIDPVRELQETSR